MALTNKTRTEDNGTVLLRTTDLAARWGLSPRTLQRWRAEGYGAPFLSIGGSIRYRLEDVLSFEDRRRQTGFSVRGDDGERVTGNEVESRR